VLGAAAQPAAADLPQEGSLLLLESFAGPEVADPRVRALGAACLTGAVPGAEPPPGGSDLRACERTNASPAPGGLPGYVQLTDGSEEQAGAVALDRAVPADVGLVLEFDQYQYGPGGTPGDGIGVMLVDGAYDLVGVGGYGGSLGYAQLGYWQAPGVVVEGVPGGVLGIGLDVHGNFANDLEGRGTGCAVASPHAGLVPNAVSLRGPGSGEEGFCWLATQSLPAAERLDVVTTDPAEARRSVRVTVGPGSRSTVTVEIDRTGTRRDYRTVLTHVLDAPLPETVKVAFAASSGAHTNVHLIGDVEVRTVEPLPPLDLVVRVPHVEGRPERVRTGATVPLDLVVTNTDAEAVTDVRVRTSRTGPDPVCDIRRLGPAGSATASASCRTQVVVQPEDARVGELVVAAAATGTGPEGPVSAADTEIVPVAGSPALSLTTAAVVGAGGGGPVEPGDTVALTYEVRNTGDVDLDGLVLHEELGTAVVCGTSVLAPGAAVTCVSDPYLLQPEDLAAGRVTSVASARADVPAHADPLAPATRTVTVPLVAATARLELEQRVTVVDGGRPDGLADAQDLLRYDVVVTNSGDLPLVGLEVEHPLAAPVTCDTTTLEPGASTVCTPGGAYEVLEADLIAGGVTSEARASARTPGGAVTEAAHVLTTPTRPALAEVAAVMTATVHDEDRHGGVRVHYGVEVTSTGTLGVHDVQVADGRVGGTELPAVTCPSARLAPGESITCTADEAYHVTDADRQAGEVVASAVVRAEPPGGGPPVAPVPVEVRTVVPGAATPPEPAPDPVDPEPAAPVAPGPVVPDADQGGGPAHVDPEAAAGPDGTDDGRGRLATTGASPAATLALATALAAGGAAVLRSRQAPRTDPST
jgi:hypothetical protein